MLLTRTQKRFFIDLMPRDSASERSYERTRINLVYGARRVNRASDTNKISGQQDWKT